LCVSKVQHVTGQKTGCNQFKLVFSVFKYLQNMATGNCNWKKTGLWFSPVQSYTGPANT
ncbi:hypothetical protein K443DRAFT_74042, partial [Laccaria amethystina LaAM-08-1]